MATPSNSSGSSDSPENPYRDNGGPSPDDVGRTSGFPGAFPAGDGEGDPTGLPADATGSDPVPPLTGGLYAGAGKRLGAFLIDQIIIGIIGLILLMVFAGEDFTTYADEYSAWDAAGQVGDAPTFDLGGFLLSSLLTLVIWFIYRVLMESRSGQTLGKKALGIKVVTAEGTTVTVGTSFKRNSWYIAVFLLSVFVGTIGGLVGLILMGVLGVTIRRSPFSQHTFDQWAKTYVVNAR